MQAPGEGTALRLGRGSPGLKSVSTTLAHFLLCKESALPHTASVALSINEESNFIFFVL